MADFCRYALRALLLSSACAGLLAGCGGGGGSGQASEQAAGRATLTFTPPVIAATVSAGRSAALIAEATVTTPADFNNVGTVYTFVIDTTGVIFPQVDIAQTGAINYRAVMQTVPTLSEGKHTGAFTVKVCRDAACNRQFPGSPMQLPYEITVLPPELPPATAVPDTPLVAAMYATNTPPAPVAVKVGAPGRSWEASTTSGWIKLSNASGSGSGAFSVAYDPAGLPLGDQVGEIVVKASNGQTIKLPVRLQLLATSFSIDRGQINFNAVNGAPIGDEAVRFTLLEGAATWSASASKAWLSMTPTGGPTPGVTTLKVDPAVGMLASGLHTNVLSINAPNVNKRDVQVNLNLTRATLTTSASNLTIGGPYGRNPNQAVLTMNLNTMTNAHPWILSALPAWLAASATAGQINQAGTAVTFSPVTSNLPYGTSSAALTATVTVNGDTLTTPVTVSANRDYHKLLFSEVGVGLSSTPTWSRLSRKVTVSDNYGLSPSWTVSSSAAWLSITRSGNELTLSADPASLPSDTISYATVSLSSTDSSIVTTEPLRVAIWKGNATPGAITKLSKTYSHLKTDPIRPLLYANNGAIGIDVYNVYTATQVGTIASLGAALGEMTVSPNGDRLYAYDTTNRNIVVVDLKTMAKVTSWPLASSVYTNSALLAIRPNGVDVVLAADGNAYLASDGRVVGKPGWSASSMSASSDGKRVYSDAGAYDVDYSAMGGGAFFSARATGTGSFSGSDIAVSGDGMRLYTAQGSPYKCSSHSGTDLSFIGYLPGGEAYPNNVEVGSDGRVFCGISGWYSAADVWMHGADGALLGSFKFAGYARNLISATMGISADGLMMVGQTDDPVLAFIPVGP